MSAVLKQLKALLAKKATLLPQELPRASLLLLAPCSRTPLARRNAPRMSLEDGLAD